MPNEIKNALKASTSHVTANHTMSRQLPVAGSSTVSVMVWTISGIVLASCGGGGGGGAGGSGLSVAGGGSNGDGGGGGSSASGPSGNIARVVDGPVKGAAVYFDIDGDGEVSDSERAAQKQNGDPMYITDANGYVNAPIAFEGHFFIANVDNATDTATGDTLSGEYQSLSTGGIATPITDLIADRMRESNADAQGVLDDIFGADGLVTVADILDAENYKILKLGDEAEKPTLPSDPTDAQQEEYDRTLAKYKTSVIMEASLALSEIDKDDGAFTNLVESPTARVDALKQIVDDDPDPDNDDTAALAERISDRVAAGREILGRKPLAQPDSSLSPIDEDSVFRFPQNSEDIFGFTDPGGNSDDADTSRFTGIYVKSSVDFSQADAGAHTVDLLYNGSPLSGHRVARGDSLPGNLPPEAGFYYVSYENLSRLSIRPSRDDSGTLEVEYYVFDGEQWSDKASLEITVSPVDDPATDVAVGAQDLTAIDENMDLTGGMKVADLDVTDADGAPHGLVVGGTNAAFFRIRNDDELWLMLQEGQLDYETTPTLTVHVEVAGANPAVRTGNITVTVNNVNDNLPIIEQLGSQIPLNEGTFPDTPTNTGYRYTASDADGGAPALSVSGDPQNRFALDASGNLQIKAGATFDYETPADRAITLTITATDSGVGSGSQTTTDTETVTINFEDVNEAPTATPKTGLSTIDNLPYPLEAVDFGFRDVDADDLDDQFYSVIITSLPGQGQGTLALNGVSVSINTPITFAQIAAGQLVYTPNEVAQGQTYNAAIGYRVVDDGDAGGANKLSSDVATLVIGVGQNQSATAVALGTQSLGDINENTVTAGMKVADLTVTDADGAPHRLAVGGAHAGFFEIRNEDELWLMLQEGQLDYETTPTLTVHVEVAGANPAARTGDITVTVNNVNDNLPMIEQLGSQIPLNEGTFPNTPTNTGYRYRASDADGGTPALSVSGDPQNRFAIDASGNLQIKAGSTFDYENPADRAITLSITATDSGVGSGSQTAADTETVIITFREINIDSGDADFDIAITIDGFSEALTVLTATEVTPDPDIDDAAVYYRYQWYHIGTGTGGADVDIAGARSKSYTIANTDEGKRIGVRVSYAEDSFQSDGITPTGRETITAGLPTASFRVRDIGSEVIFDNSGNVRVARISAPETSDILILDDFSFFNMVDSTNPLRATSSGTGNVLELSGDDKDYFMFVLYDNYATSSSARDFGVFPVTRTEFDYENPADKNGDNDYHFTLSSYNSGRLLWTADYVLTITDDNSDNFRDYPRDVTFTHTTTAGGNTAVASITETGYRLKFTSLEDAIRAYSGVDDALGASATFGGAVVDSANPHRAIVTFEVAGQADIVFTYELSGDDVNDVLLVQDGNDASLVTVAGLDYENPVDEDEMNTYSVVETITTASPNVPSAHRTVSKTYTLSIIDNPSDYSVEVYESQPLYRPIEIDSVDLQGYELTEGYLDNPLFTIDEDGQVWWKAVSDYEAPRDNGHDNIYEIELSRTNNGQTDRVQVNIKVKDIGIGTTSEEDYSPRFYLYPIDIADEYLPRDFVQHLIIGYTWKVPETGPAIIQYSFDTDRLTEFYTRDPRRIDNQHKINYFHSVLDAALLSFEQAANLKFIEVAHGEDDDDAPHIALRFNIGGASSRVSYNDGKTSLLLSTDHIGGDKIYTADAQRTIIHELGHALGLAHPFAESGRPGVLGLFWPGDEDYRYSPLSVMSYNDDVIALQSADIEALQFLYGAPGTNFMGVESIMAESGFASRLAVGAQDLTAIDENTDLTAGIKVADITVTDRDSGAFGTIEAAGDYAEFFEIRNSTELWLVLEEGETLENITELKVYLRIAEKNVVRTDDITITVNDPATDVALGTQDLTAIDENTVTGGVKAADLDVTDADGAPHGLVLSGANAGLFAIRNDDELWLVVNTGETLDYETTPTLTVQVGVSGDSTITPVNITVAVNDVNEAPTATPRVGISTNDHRAYTLEAVDFGFSDVDAGDSQLHSVIITSLPGQGQGTLELNGASVRVGDAITFAQIDADQLVYTPNEVSQGQITYNAAIGYRVVDDGDAGGANKLSSDAATLVIAVGQNQSATAVTLGTQSLGDINENTVTAGMKVADLDVTDADGAPHRLAVGGAHAGFFEIRNEDELWLMLQEGQLDYETTPTLTVHVEVAGANPAVRTGNITVAVNNVNDNLPMIEQLGSQIPLDEGTFSNTPTNTGYRYTASDADGGTSTLSVSGDPQNRFAIDASGNLQIKAGSEFDYENPADRTITLTITATDSGVGAGSSPAAATQEVTITFGDANDAPTATPRSGISTNDHRAYPLEAMDFGFRDVDADDLDDQFHSVIITFLPGQGQGTLALNGVSVSVGDEITFTDINNGWLIYTPNEVQPGQITYNAAIGYRVVDDGDAAGGNGLRSDTASLVIAVGQNQSATAVVLGTQSLGDINENTVTAGMKIADLTVTDADGAPHRLVVGGAHAGFFEIRNEDELWLMLQEGQLDYETTPTLTVHVEVAGASPAVRTGNITVTVNNVNDNLPMIEPLGSQIPLDEGRFDINTFTGYRYRASDADGGAPTLSVSGDPQNRFAIDASGKLQIKAGSEFNYESLDEGAITLTITATDSGVGAGSQTAADTETVIITFKDVNIDSGDADFSIASDSHLAAGTMLTATEVTPDPDIDDAVYSYQWYHIGAGTGGPDVDIAGATSKSYTIADTDEGKRIGVRVSYAEDSFQSDGITPTGTETITARLPTAVFRVRDIRSEIIFDHSSDPRVARISAPETSDILILDEVRYFSRVDSTNPLRATRSTYQVAELSGDDKDYFMFVLYRNDVTARDIFLVTRTELDYENPADKNGDNDYHFTLSISFYDGRLHSTADYVLTITDDNYDNFRDYPRDVTFTHTTTAGGDTASASVTETGSRLKFTSLEDAIRAYSGIDHALGASETFGGAVVDSANPHRAIVTFEVAGQADIVFTYELSGDDANEVLLVQDGNDASLVTVAGLDYENPADEDEMNTYSVVETITTASPSVPSAHRVVSKTYTLSVIDNPSDYSVEVYESHPLYRPIEIDSVDLRGYELTEGYLDNPSFTIDEDGQVWWTAVSDYEDPRDGNRDNLYEIELSRTNNGQIDRVQVDIRVKNIGIDSTSEEDYSPIFRLYPTHIADDHLPSEFVQHLILGYTWKVPKTGPVIIQYSIDTDVPAIIYNNNQVRIDKFYSVLEEALLSFEEAANLKFIEVAHGEAKDDAPHIYLEFSNSNIDLSSAIFNIGSSDYDHYVELTLSHLHVGNIYSDRAQWTIIHELGHALGLAHPFSEGGRILPGLIWPGDENYRYSPLSVMSYDRSLTALQSADIEALQFLYGAPGTNFMGVESIMAESQFARELAIGAQDLTEIDENTDLTAGIKVADITVTDRDGGVFGTLEAAGTDAEFFEIRNSTELWLVLEEYETLEDIATLEVHVQLVEKNGTRTNDITIMVNDAGSSGAEGSSGPVGDAGDANQIRIDETVDEGQSMIANLIDLDLGAIDLTEITVGGGDKDQVQIRPTQNGGVLEFVSAPDFEAPEDDDEDNVYEITLYDDLMSIEVDITVIDIPEL